MALQPDDFNAAIQILAEAWSSLDEQTKWENVAVLRQHSTTFLRITKSFPSDQPQQPEHEEDDDEEALEIPVPPPQVVYDIVYSPSYQVPVLYVTARGISADKLVPESRKAAVSAVGVMGALSMTEHPVTGMPVLFVHPCRTQEVMEGLIDGRGMRPEGYLMLWFGVVGGSVGLDVPVRLAEAMAGA